MNQPFDLWPVEVTVATRNVSLVFDSYSLTLDEGILANDTSNLDIVVRNQQSAREDDVMKIWLPVTAGTAEASFAGTGQSYQESLPFTIARPGRYLASEEGLQPF